MSRTPKGTVERADGKLRVRVTVKDDTGETYRPWVELPPKLTDDAARRVALRWAEAQQGKPRQRVVNGQKLSSSPTGDEYFEKLWAPSREGKVKSLEDDRGRWRNHLSALIGKKPMAEVTTEDMRGVVEALDAKAADPAIRFGKKSAVNCWTVVSTMFDDACNSKQAKLRILKTNPAAGIQPPDAPDEVEKQWLFPVELRQLLACDAVPLERRRLYAGATYCYTRPGEALALLWRLGIDLEHGMVRVNRAWDSREKRFNEYTKTGDSRHFRIEPLLLPMFEAMFNRRRTELVFPTLGKLAELLRADLLTAGVDRPALHKPKPGAELMRFHDLRATGITYMAIRGDSDNAIRERAGHTDFQTTLMYIRRGHQSLGSSIGDPFAPLPPSLLGIVRESSGGSSGGSRVHGPASETATNSASRDLQTGLEGFKSLLPLQQSGTSEAGSDVETKSGDDSPDDSYGAALLSACAARGRRLAAFAEADHAAGGPGLALCRGLAAAYAGDHDATLAALADAYVGLGLDERARAAGGSRGR